MTFSPLKNILHKNKAFLWLCLRCCAVLFLAAAFVNPAFAGTKTIMAFGDSLTAGLGLPPEQAFPVRLEARLKESGDDVKVVNAGVSGDTTSGGLTRLAWQLDQEKPDYLILALGANDMLRAVDPKTTAKNLHGMLEILRARHIPVLLSGMKSFSNMGTVFSGKYEKMYEALAEEYGAVYQPFFLEGVAMKNGLMQDDGLHPNAAGVEKMVDDIMPYIKKLLKK